jgi:hypothetical protein
VSIGQYGKIANPPREPALTNICNRSVMTYKSEITAFLEDLKGQRPELDEQQRSGRALLWDKAPLDLEERERARLSRIPQKSYVYMND